MNSYITLHVVHVSKTTLSYYDTEQSRMPNSRSDDSQDVGSSKDSQDGSQMLDSVKIQDLVDRHTASVSVPSKSRPVDKLIHHCHRSGLAVVA